MVEKKHKIVVETEVTFTPEEQRRIKDSLGTENIVQLAEQSGAQVARYCGGLGLLAGCSLATKVEGMSEMVGSISYVCRRFEEVTEHCKATTYTSLAADGLCSELAPYLDETTSNY